MILHLDIKVNMLKFKKSKTKLKQVTVKLATFIRQSDRFLNYQQLKSNKTVGKIRISIGTITTIAYKVNKKLPHHCKTKGHYQKADLSTVEFI